MQKLSTELDTTWVWGIYCQCFEKTWPSSYGGRGGTYGGEGVSVKKRIIKEALYGDNAKRHHQVSYRTYGEFADKENQM